jgi:hypothetical protein
MKWHQTNPEPLVHRNDNVNPLLQPYSSGDSLSSLRFHLSSPGHYGALRIYLKVLLLPQQFRSNHYRHTWGNTIWANELPDSLSMTRISALCNLDAIKSILSLIWQLYVYTFRSESVGLPVNSVASVLALSGPLPTVWSLPRCGGVIEGWLKIVSVKSWPGFTSTLRKALL